VLVVGADDVTAGTVGVNRRGTDQAERGVPVGRFADELRADIETRRAAPLGAGDGSDGA